MDRCELGVCSVGFTRCRPVGSVGFTRCRPLGSDVTRASTALSFGLLELMSSRSREISVFELI